MSRALLKQFLCLSMYLILIIGRISVSSPFTLIKNKNKNKNQVLLIVNTKGQQFLRAVLIIIVHNTAHNGNGGAAYRLKI